MSEEAQKPKEQPKQQPKKVPVQVQEPERKDPQGNTDTPTMTIIDF